MRASFLDHAVITHRKCTASMKTIDIPMIMDDFAILFYSWKELVCDISDTIPHLSKTINILIILKGGHSLHTAQ